MVFTFLLPKTKHFIICWVKILFYDVMPGEWRVFSVLVASVSLVIFLWDECVTSIDTRRAIIITG
jgi:hypothetical protein